MSCRSAPTYAKRCVSGSTLRTPGTEASCAAIAGDAADPAGSVTVTSAPLVRRASTSACCWYVELKTAVDAAKATVTPTRTTAGAMRPRWRDIEAATVEDRGPARGRLTR